MAEPILRALSLGAGVQSTTLALMAARGEIKAPDCAIFADTGWEPTKVYSHLAWLESVLPFPVHHVTAGNIRDDIVHSSTNRTGRVASIPWFLRQPNGAKGMGRRQCTKHYKVEPIRRKIRELLGVGARQYIAPGAVEMWIGISTDEAVRAKPSQRRYITHRHILLDLRFSRAKCERWLMERQYPVAPKSACIGCPYHEDETWEAMDPVEIADAASIDRLIRNAGAIRGIRAEQFMHSSCKPLDEVDFAAIAEKRTRQYLLFNNDCDGICGV